METSNDLSLTTQSPITVSVFSLLVQDRYGARPAILPGVALDANVSRARCLKLRTKVRAGGVYVSFVDVTPAPRYGPRKGYVDRTE
jgi:hypothetical protein